jgi:predicted nucleic acid-binding protein
VTLVDSDVLIEFLRNSTRATHRLDQLSELCFSAVTWMELLQGCRDKRELAALEKDMRQWKAQRLSLTPSITDRAIDLIGRYAASSGLRIADALIAATAIEHERTLLTGNVRHFRSIEGLRIETFPIRPWSSVHEPAFSYYAGPETIYRVVEVEG